MDESRGLQDERKRKLCLSRRSKLTTRDRIRLLIAALVVGAGDIPTLGGIYP